MNNCFYLNQILQGDCKELLLELEDDSVDAVVTDPPYEIKFMGRGWDGVGIAYDVEMWEQVWRVLKPGGHLLSFGGTRTSHRMVCAIEDAGFEIRDTICYLYGSGFPKSRNLKDKWDGWGTALKPAHEPIVVARKPLKEKTVAKNVLAHGTGAMNIDATRIAHTEDFNYESKCRALADDKNPIYVGGTKPGDAIQRYKEGGRWPANVILDEESSVALDEMTGEFSGGASHFFYCAKANKKERGEDNNHPTVKPLALMRYFCKLVTPPDGVILDPFMGSGTTGIAAKMEGFNFIGIEQDESYCEIARKRIDDQKLTLKDVE